MFIYYLLILFWFWFIDITKHLFIENIFMQMYQLGTPKMLCLWTYQAEISVHIARMGPDVKRTRHQRMALIILA